MKCPYHTDVTMKMTEWRPPGGFDPKLRQFVCPICQRVAYKIPQGFACGQEPAKKAND